MMKRNILAVVIPALLAAGAANAAEIYNKGSDKLELNGKVDGLHYFSDDDSNNGDQSYVRFGFKGETQINNSLTGYGQWEYNIQANNSEGADAQTDNKTRLAFAGLRFDKLGSIDYGRNYGVLHNVTSWTDVLPEFGGDASITDNFMGGRATGVLTYSNSNFFDLVPGMDFAVQYQGKNDRADTARANGDGWGLSTSYKTNIGLAFAAAYSSSDRTDAQTRGNVYSDGSYVGYGVGEGKRAESWVTAVKYDENNVYLAALYGETHNATPIKAVYENGDSETAFANKAQNLEVVAQYKFDFGLTPSLAYVQSKGKDIEGIGKADLYKYIEVGATYQFNPNMSTYVDYKINQMDKDNSLGLKTDDIVALGLVYQF